MNEFTNAAITIVTIVGTIFASMMIIKASLKESIDHIIKSVDRLEADQKETNARIDAQAMEFRAEQRATNARMDQLGVRLDQLYTMLVDMIREGKK